MQRAWGGAIKRLRSRPVAQRRRWLSRPWRRAPQIDINCRVRGMQNLCCRRSGPDSAKLLLCDTCFKQF